MSDSNQEKKSPFDDYSFAVMYEKRNAQLGYPGKILDYVIEYIKQYTVTSVADIGAGTGAFSIPLAIAGYTVYAIEPAFGMRSILYEKIKNLYVNVTIYPNTLETIKSLKADACIAMHSIYGIKPLEKALVNMMHIAPLVMIAVRTEKTYTVSDVIRRYFKKERSKHHLQHINTYLKEHSIPHEIHCIHQVHKVQIHDIYQEALFHCYAMGFDQSHVDTIITILEKHLNKNGSYWFENVHDDAIVIIHS
ncbi:MAG: methyltransferase domain-containing protein [Spirochaetota bacterium]